MATIMTSFSDHPLTSQIGNITAQTDSPRETVTVAHYDAGQNYLFSTVLYAFNGYVTLYDVASIIEEDMRKYGMSVGDYLIRIGNDSLRIEPVYCDYMAVGLNLDGCFLSTMTSQRVYVDSAFEINSLPNRDPVNLVCLYRDSDGVTGSYAFPSSGPDFEHGCVRGTFRMILDRLNEELNAEVSLIAVTVRNGSRSKTYYIMPGDADVHFYFRNCFNAFDYIDLKGIITEKTAVSRELAICAGRASQYDRRVNQTFEFQSEPLTMQEAETVSQLVASHEVYLEHGESVERILVTDHTCEIDNDDAALCTVKITWRYVDGRAHLTRARIEDLLTEGGIFTTQFTEQFQ